MKANKHTESYPILKTFFNLLSILEKKMAQNIISKKDILSFSYYYYEHYCSADKYKYCLEKDLKSYENLYNNSSTN